jgi:hypothetical protein
VVSLIAYRIRRLKENCLKRNARTTLKISADRAAHALHLLIADGKIAAKDVTNALKRREAMISDLRKRLIALEQGAISGIGATGRELARTATRKRRKMSPARLAALRLNGSYMGYVRRLSKAQKASLKKIRETKGVRAAIAAARKIAQ